MLKTKDESEKSPDLTEYYRKLLKKKLNSITDISILKILYYTVMEFENDN